MLTFARLRKANQNRLKQFKNKHGELVHINHNDWSPAQWLQACVGELGEYANFRKKFERGDITYVEFIENARKELADVLIYLDLLANSLHINFGEAIMEKFNEVSERIGAAERLYTHYLLLRYEIGDEFVMVKTAEFFESQDGLKSEWGKAWIGVVVDGGIEDARELGILMNKERRKKDQK